MSDVIRKVTAFVSNGNNYFTYEDNEAIFVKTVQNLENWERDLFSWAYAVVLAGWGVRDFEPLQHMIAINGGNATIKPLGSRRYIESMARMYSDSGPIGEKIVRSVCGAVRINIDNNPQHDVSVWIMGEARVKAVNYSNIIQYAFLSSKYL